MTNQILHPVDGRLTTSVATEKLCTISDAANKLGVHVWALRRAVNNGTIPAYRPFNSRVLVRLSEVVAAINASKMGGE